MPKYSLFHYVSEISKFYPFERALLVGVDIRGCMCGYFRGGGGRCVCMCGCLRGGGEGERGGRCVLGCVCPCVRGAYVYLFLPGYCRAARTDCVKNGFWLFSW